MLRRVERGGRGDRPGAAALGDQRPGSWDAALRLLAVALPADRPAIVVLDEMPYLIRNDPGFEGTLQKIFDRELSRRPVLLLCVGSDLAVMERLNDYDRPFHQRATEMAIPPLNPADVAEMLDLPPAEAFDAYLVTGGLPLLLEEFDTGVALFDHLAEVVEDPTSAAVVSGERSLAAEFPVEAHARLVLGAIGAGERSHALIGRAAGGMAASSLSRALRLLTRQARGGRRHPAVRAPVEGDPLHRRRPAPPLLAGVPRPGPRPHRAGPRRPGAGAPARPDAEDGRGLLMLQMLAARWGCDLYGGRQPFGKSVYFELLN